MKKAYKLNDDVIAEIARLLQVALLTGTDIVDNIRTIRLERAGDSLALHPTYSESQEKNIEKMLEEINELSDETSETDEFSLNNKSDDGIFH